MNSFFARCLMAVSAICIASSVQAQNKDNLRLEIVTALPNNAVSAAIAGKRPSQWDTSVMDLLFQGKAQSPECGTVAVVWFTHMFTETSGGRVWNYLNQAPMDLARFDFNTHRIERTGAQTSVFMRPVETPGQPTTYMQEITVPLIRDAQGRMGGAVYIPRGAIRASTNPIMGISIPGMKLRGLPQGNNSNGAIRWSTPKNNEFGTGNELHRQMPHNNDTAVLVGEC